MIKVNFYRILTRLITNLSFSYSGCHTKLKEYGLPYYFRQAGERRVGFIVSIFVLFGFI